MRRLTSPAHNPSPEPRAPSPCRLRRPGFTLVELMVTMAIIAILGAAMAYAVAASSAVPVLLHQVTLRDFATTF